MTEPKGFAIKLSGDIWPRWQARHEELSEKWQGKLAGLFKGHEDPGFRHSAKKVLYTGKATAGPFTLENADEDYFGCNKKAFWSFAKRLSRLTGGDSDKLENIAWSNLCKIGSVSGNPNQELVDAQRDLAVETLRQEWVELKPTLVVCVTEDYQENLIREALGVVEGKDGFQPRETSAGVLWTRKAANGMPAFLWMKHPQGKRLEYIEAAQSLAEEMLLA